MTSPNLAEKIRSEIILSGRDTRYALQAYLFILEGLEYCRVTGNAHRHVTGQQLSRACAEYACKQFGPMASAVLGQWGVKSTEDFGYIVYNLIDIRVLHKQDSDSLADFFGILSLDEYFANHDPYTVDKNYIKSIEGA